MTYLLSLDPGGTTGYALWEVDESAHLMQWGFFKTWTGLDRFLGTDPITPVDAVVCERVIKNLPQVSGVGIEVIGVIQYLCDKHNIAVQMQNPTVIRAVDKWKVIPPHTAKNAHEHDAIAHGIAHFTRKNIPVTF